MFAANAVGGTVPANAPTLRLRSQDVADSQKVEMQLGTVSFYTRCVTGDVGER